MQMAMHQAGLNYPLISKMANYGVNLYDEHCLYNLYLCYYCY